MSADITDRLTGSGRLSATMRKIQEQQERQRVGSSANTGLLRRTTDGGTVVRGRKFQRVQATLTDTGVWV